MRSPSVRFSPPSSQQQFLGALDNFNDFISSDSSDGTASDEQDEFEPPSGEQKWRVASQNGMARPRRFAGLCHSADTAQQQQQLRKSPRKKALRPKNTASTSQNGRKKLSTDEGTAATSSGNTNASKRAVKRVGRDKSSSSIGSSLSMSSPSSSIAVNELAADERASPVTNNSRRGLFSPVRRGRGGPSRAGGGHLPSLQHNSAGKLSENDDGSSPLRLDVTNSSRLTATGSSRRGGGLARRSRGPVTLAKMATMGNRTSAFLDAQNEQQQEENGERAVQHQKSSRGGRSGRSGRRGSTGQQRVQRRNFVASRAEDRQVAHPISESSSSPSENEEGGTCKKQFQFDPSEEEQLSLSSSSSSSSSNSTTSEDEEEAETQQSEWPRGNSLGLLSPPVLQQMSQKQRQQMPCHSSPLVSLSQRRRKKKSKWPELQRRPQKQLPKEFDHSNPYETYMDPYQRKMREAFILYRFLGEYSPVLRSFMHRNLYYMRCKRPPKENFTFPNVQNVYMDDAEVTNVKNGLSSSSVAHHRSTNHLQNNHHHLHSAHCQHPSIDRTSSRLSNKFPTTIRPTFIRNNLFFGQKKATVQCFHVSECNGRLSSMKNIPSATFQMKVNERIRNISIDLPDELHADVLSGDKSKSEYLVVRVVFHFEDAEIGGRHLRKVPSRQSSNIASDQQNQQQQQQQHCLRKNGPADACNVVMFGAKRIFSFKPSGELKVINDEASITLFTNTQLLFESNCLKLTSIQLSRLIHGNLKPIDGGSSPFITVNSHGDSDDEDEEDDDDDEEEDEEKDESRRENGQQNGGPKLKKPKVENGTTDGERTMAATNVSKEGLSLREAMEAMDMADNNGGQNRANGTATDAAVMRKELLKMPKVIGLKFWLHSPGISRAVHSSVPQLPPGSPPGQQRRRLLFRAAAANANASLTLCAEQQHRTIADHWEASSSSKRSSSDSAVSFASSSALTAALLPPPTSSSSSPPSSVAFPPFICRQFPSSRCFFCLTSLRVRNLWALQKHLTFCHPRFEFCFETSIRVLPTLCLPGFSISQNVKYDASNELPSVRTAVRPTWIVNKPLAREMRRVDNFPIERYTTVVSKQNTAEEYIRLKGRFNFETPTRIDQLWMRQMSIRKLNDITDLHPAECATMQMWNSFLFRARITLFGRRMLYRALRIFVKYHSHEIDARHLRTHFLLHLTCLLNTGAIDEEERYDLYRRMDPKYDPCGDSQHIVGREMKALSRELNTSQNFGIETVDGGNGAKRGHKSDKFRRSSNGPHHRHPIGGGRMKLRHPQCQQTNNNNNATTLLNGTLKKSAASASAVVELLQQPRRRLSSPLPLPTVSASPTSSGCTHFISCQALRERFPFASSKRIALLWKFLQDYDFPTAYDVNFKQ